MAKEIPLTRGKFVIVDDEDFDWLNQWKWQCSNYNSAYRRAGRTIVIMSRLIADAPPETSVVFKDGNSLNCRRNNLVVGPKAVQRHGQKRWANKQSSQYKGVFWDKRKGKGGKGMWFARIKVNYKPIFLGYFDDEADAARAYDEAALKYFGEHARTNFKIT